jgi:hypothetical protein
VIAGAAEVMVLPFGAMAAMAETEHAGTAFAVARPAIMTPKAITAKVPARFIKCMSVGSPVRRRQELRKIPYLPDADSRGNNINRIRHAIKY